MYYASSIKPMPYFSFKFTLYSFIYIEKLQLSEYAAPNLPHVQAHLSLLAAQTLDGKFQDLFSDLSVMYKPGFVIRLIHAPAVVSAELWIGQ